MEREQVIETGRFVPLRGPGKPSRIARNVEEHHGVRERRAAKDVGEQPETTEEAPVDQIPIVDFGKSGFVGVVGGLESLLPASKKQAK